MRKILLIITIFTLSGFISCMNLDVEPQNAVTFENYFKTEKDIQIFLDYVKSEYRYSIVQCVNFSNQIEKGYYMDNIRSSSIKNNRDLDPSQNSPNSSTSDWNYFYKLIASCNVLIENANKLEFLSQESVDMYVAQAYFYRAHAYFWLAQNWGDAPIVLNSVDISARAKQPFDKVLAQALSDADKAIKGLMWYRDLRDNAGAPSSRRDLLTKEAAYSLSAYIFAWKASLNDEPALYKSAIAALDEVLKQQESYDLAGSPEEVCTMVLEGGHHKESIFEVHMSWNDNIITNQHTPAYFLTQFPIVPANHEGDIADANGQVTNVGLDKMFPKGDARREAYFYKTDSYRDEASLAITKGFAFPYKFRYPLLVTSGWDAGWMDALGNLRVMFRVADLLLLRAECYVRDGEDGKAIIDLNRVRSRSKAALYGTVEEPGDLRYTIFKEREKELLWECHRYFDILRNGYYKEISEVFGKLTPTEIKNGAIYAPVSYGAFKDNPLMTQNKYWLSRY